MIVSSVDSLAIQTFLLQITYVDFFIYEVLDMLRTFDANIYGSDVSNLTVSS